jgi:aminopeptidase N
MGPLNDVNETPGASFTLNAFKGAYVIQMLRSTFRDPQSGDRDFQAMLQDFFRSYAGHAASTEDFKTIVEKHMKPEMDLDGNHRMNWFFNEWLYCQDIPSYRLDYSLKADANGGTLLEGKLTQSGVSPEFKMLVPVFADVAGRKERIAMAAMGGSATKEFKLRLRAQPKQILLNINHDVLTEKDQVSVVK